MFDCEMGTLESRGRPRKRTVICAAFLNRSLARADLPFPSLPLDRWVVPPSVVIWIERKQFHQTLLKLLALSLLNIASRRYWRPPLPCTRGHQRLTFRQYCSYSTPNFWRNVGSS